MNISDVERLTGLSRANVRFYEKQGLLAPARQENGYRDYTKDHVDTLKKIRLLREVSVPLEQIRQVIETPASLHALLEKHVSVIRKEIQRQQSALSVCEEMHRAGVDFDTLDAEKYLARMAELQQAAAFAPTKKSNALLRDVEPFQPHPFRRLLARRLDFLLYGSLLALLLNGVLGIYMEGWLALLQHALLLGVTLVTEPFLLSIAGTTPGKWIFGIHIDDENGQRLSYRQGFARTKSVLIQGMGFDLPVICWICAYFARKRYVEVGCTSWDYEVDYQVQVRPRGKWILSWLAGIALLAFCQQTTEWIDKHAYLPPHQGQITLAEFTENYNHIVKTDARNHGNTDINLLITDMLDHGGAYFGPEHRKDGVVVIEIMENAPLELKYELEDGFLKAVSFDAELEVSSFFSGYQDEMRCILFALGDLSAWNDSIREMNSRTKELAFRDYQWESLGVRVQCDVNWNEENWIRFSSDSVMTPSGEAERYAISFRAEKVENE